MTRPARRRGLMLTLGFVALAGCGGGGGGGDGAKIEDLTPTEVTLEGLTVPADAEPIDLKGFDVPTELDGDCFEEYVLLAAGFDGTAQRYVLSFELKGDPADVFDLYTFLEEKGCGDQQREAYDKVVAALEVPAGQPVPVEISYHTTKGRRLFQ